MVRNPLAAAGDIRDVGREDPLEKETATHSSLLAWRIPRTEEPGGLQSMGTRSRIRLNRLRMGPLKSILAYLCVPLHLYFSSSSSFSLVFKIRSRFIRIQREAHCTDKCSLSLRETVAACVFLLVEETGPFGL